ncbi:hypothetical protein pah_c003o005 [Parachlamydia acanthamoebae str. Hall's coccus]|nr:hypothetical protein pah_c003o005 [Parachlamydia acanthamoebae str. Hall's coccus]
MMHLQEKLKDIQFVILDIDGTLTDGSMYYTHDEVSNVSMFKMGWD